MNGSQIMEKFNLFFIILLERDVGVLLDQTLSSRIGVIWLLLLDSQSLDLSKSRVMSSSHKDSLCG